MASVNISKWDIAQAFGLYYEGITEDVGPYKDIEDFHTFSFYGEVIKIKSDYYTSRDDAHEQAAEQVIEMIARCAVAKAAVAMSEK